jgi:hypothetical protein
MMNWFRGVGHMHVERSVEPFDPPKDGVAAYDILAHLITCGIS